MEYLVKALQEEIMLVVNQLTLVAVAVQLKKVILHLEDQEDQPMPLWVELELVTT
jgi:hypothetical protein